ncbi:MAG: S-layer homology domain-containing protein [Paludibacteraceae bacterium]|nr:S-layer homology domain-containing protein [Paludibacteraceae bacterium]
MKKIIKYFALLTAIAALFAVMSVAAFADEPEVIQAPDLSLVFSPETQLVVYIDGEWSDALSDTYGYGESVTLAAPDVENKTFAYWEADGSIVSYAKELKLTVNANTTLFAVYANNAPTAKPVAGFTSITRSTDGNSIAFNAIASGDDAGVVYSTKTTGNNLKIDGSDVTNVPAVKLTNDTAMLPQSVIDGNNCYSYKLKPESSDTVYHVRAYVTVNGETTYGDVKDVKLSELQSGVSMIANLEGFEQGIGDDLAKLTEGMHTVTYYANGGVGAPLTQAYKGTSVALRSNTFTREGYNFAGWSTEEKGKVEYKDGESVTPEGNLVLYAQWSLNYIAPSTIENTIAKAENGTIKLEPEKAAAGQTVKVTATPDAGYKLAELTVKDASGKEIELTKNEDGTYSFTQPSGKVTVEAKFAKEVKFVDVPENSYYAKAVDWAVEKGITNGVDENHFAPDATCTRAQAVTFLWRALGCPEPTATKSEFTDVTDANAFYYKAVLWATENGVTNGIGDGSFGVNGIVNRAQMVTFMARAMNGKATTAESFADVPEGAYFADAAAWAKENGISNGIGDNKFGSNENCARAQIVTMLYRYFVK